MRSPRTRDQGWNGRTVKITIVDSQRHGKRVRDAIARQAFAIFESCGSSPGDASRDWRRAESEVVQPLCCGFIVDDKKISVETDASIFEEGLIEICTAPRRLTICGRCSVRTRASQPKIRRSGPPREVVFHVLDLPVAVDPSKVMAQFNGRVLIIDLPLCGQVLTYVRPSNTGGPGREPAARMRCNAL